MLCTLLGLLRKLQSALRSPIERFDGIEIPSEPTAFDVTASLTGTVILTSLPAEVGVSTLDSGNSSTFSTAPITEALVTGARQTIPVRHNSSIRCCSR